MENPAPLHPNPKVAEALSFLQAAEQSASSGTSTGLVWAVQQYDYALERLRPIEDEAPDFRRWLALALLGKGNAVLNRRQENALTDGLACFDESLAVLSRGAYPDENLRLNDRANAHMARGLALSASGPDAAPKAIEAFDASIEARKQVAEGKPDEIRHAVAVAWVSRSDAALRTGNVEYRDEAIRSLDEAIAIFTTLPVEANEWLRHQLAMAWMNRGIASQAGLVDQASLLSARDSFDEALKLVKGQAILERPEGKHLLACTLLNRGGVAARLEGAQPAREVHAAAKEALEVVRASAEQAVPLSEVALRARLLIGKAATDLAENNESGEARDFISDATDSVDEGLELIKVWEKRNVQAFRPFAVDLFCLGAVVYQRYQPQFLSEYLLEVLDPERSPEALGGNQDMYRVAMEALAKAIQQHQQYSFAGIGDPALEKKLETLKDLREAESRLRILLAPRPKTSESN